MRTLVDLMLMLSAVLLVLRLVFGGLITIGHAALALVGLVILLGVARARKSIPATLALSIGLPMTALALFLLEFSGGNPSALIGLLSAVMPLLLVLLGILVMVRGTFK